MILSLSFERETEGEVKKRYMVNQPDDKKVLLTDIPDTHTQEVVTYYEDTGLDYGQWSREYNMHFGYYRFPMNPFGREKMLDKMNQVVIDNLGLTGEDKLVYDLGCGLAAPCRSFAENIPVRQ